MLEKRYLCNIEGRYKNIRSSVVRFVESQRFLDHKSWDLTTLSGGISDLVYRKFSGADEILCISVLDINASANDMMHRVMRSVSCRPMTSGRDNVYL